LQCGLAVQAVGLDFIGPELCLRCFERLARSVLTGGEQLLRALKFRPRRRDGGLGGGEVAIERDKRQRIEHAAKATRARGEFSFLRRAISMPERLPFRLFQR
jgi:hypothetical protein